MDDTVYALDLGATNVRAAVVKKDGTCCSFRQETVAGIDDTGILLQKIVNLLRAVTGNFYPSAIGISTAGPVDIARGCVVHSPNMHVSELPLVSCLQKEFGLPVTMATDCKAGVLGESVYGVADGVSGTVVYITVSSGIGCGVLEHGTVISGTDGNAGECGHFTVDTEYHLPCGCGGFGHWESYCSGRGIPRFFAAWRKRHGYPELKESAESVLTKAVSGTEPYAEFSRELIRMNTRALQSVICAYNPEVIVLDGPVALQYPFLFSGDTGTYLRKPDIRFSTLAGKSPLLGAAYSAFFL